MKLIEWVKSWRPVPAWWHILNNLLWLAMLLWLGYVIAEEKGVL